MDDSMCIQEGKAMKNLKGNVLDIITAKKKNNSNNK